jgi:type I restriction enzyme S subunit
VVVSLLDACCPGRPITYGILKPGPELTEGVPYVRVADFPGNRLRLDSIKKTSHEIDEQFRRARLRAGDLLLSIRGSVGRVIEIPPSLDGANITQDTARLSISGRLNRRYVHLALQSEGVQLRMQGAMRGVAVRGINIGDVRALQIPLPPRVEQDEIVRRVEALFAFGDRLERRLVLAQTAASRLTPSLLAKAFRGELVPQDPADEPTSALLARVHLGQQTPAAAIVVKRPRGRPKKSA